MALKLTVVWSIVPAQATVAPMVEQRIENSCVTGSSPVCGTKYL